MSDAQPAGWYHGAGDPPGTVRYWDGSAWTTDPVPQPPGWGEHARSTIEYGSALRRVAASIIDGLLAFAVALPFFIAYLGDVFDDIDAGGDGSDVPIPFSFTATFIAVAVVYLLMVAYRGGTPGKLMLGLRITTGDGETTPPGFVRALRRSIPAFLGWVPVLGQLIGVGVPLA
ncbi:MAG: RDD family protein, partial [Actinomycetota bacterium]